jgi:PIN domain nuclease of toxin-antitoxin system
MKILLDTQCWLWWIASPEKLNRSAVDLIRDSGNTVYLSAASSWEIAIKASLGKLRLSEPPDVFVPQWMARSRVTALPVQHAHALRVAVLPPLHRDPFDRLLVAQAQVEGIPLLTADRKLQVYEVEWLFAGG